MSGYGFIYFATNPAMPGVTKIGMSTKHPEVRLSELSSSTACPQPFELLAFFDTPCPQEAEQGIHAALSHYRVNNRREFFAVPLADLQEQARRWGDSSRIVGCFSLKLLDALAHDEEERREHAAYMAKVI